MTTVAWDGTELAGDRKAVFGGTPMRIEQPKVARVRAPGGRIALVGFSGAMSVVLAYRHFMAGGPRPDYGDQSQDTALNILLIDDTCRVWFRTSKRDIWEWFNVEQWAIGSGCDYALGAMAAGATAREAVRIASKLDNGTGFGVDAVRF